MDDLKRKRRERLLKSSEQRNDRWQQFVESFGLQKPGISPWDASLLDYQYTGASHGEKCIIAFLLNVWNSDYEWSCGKFDAVDAMSV